MIPIVNVRRLALSGQGKIDIQCFVGLRRVLIALNRERHPPCRGEVMLSVTKRVPFYPGREYKVEVLTILCWSVLSTLGDASR